MISQKKILYPISDPLRNYLTLFGRMSTIPIIYDDLLRFNEAFPYENPAGEETLWRTVLYPQEELAELRPKLTRIYAFLKIGGDMSLAEHLTVDRIDFGEFGNSRPFRVRVTNQFNDNSDYFYVKNADASRICGLELEHILSPNRINFLVNGNTLIEEHIAGVPGDIFMRTYFDRPTLNKVRVAKEFVKFNERCFIRLLGDMRSVNYVVDITPDFEQVQYRVRPIDFDQQSYEGGRKIYLAQFFKDNNPVVNLVTSLLNDATIMQYRKEERTLVAKRRKIAQVRLDQLLGCMNTQQLSSPEKFLQLRNELMEYHATDFFNDCHSMGELVEKHIDYTTMETAK